MDHHVSESATSSTRAGDILGELALRISPGPLLGAMIVLGPAVYLLVVALSGPTGAASRFMTVSVILQALAVVAWLCAKWSDVAGRWLTIIAVAATIVTAAHASGRSELLALLVVAPALAAGLISFRGAILTAVGETLALCLMWVFRYLVGDAVATAVHVAGIWAVVGVTYLLYRPVAELAQWSQGYYQAAQIALQDARDRKAALEQALDDLAHANRQLMLANERTAELRAIAEEAQKAKTAFVANVSHEFRTPLNMIIGLVELMVETPEIYTVSLSAAMQEDLRVVYRNCEHLAALVNDVLDLTRMEAGQLALHRERIDLAAVVANSVATIRPLLDKKHLALDVTLCDGLPRVYCDRTRLQQVVLNLLSNAARFTETGGIKVGMGSTDHHVTIEVTDTGPGIDPADAARIFEPFHQASRELWRDTGGSGLGLSISEQFVKLHGGRMWLESELGVGSTFHIELPISGPLVHAARAGHQISEDWVWLERRSRAGVAALPPIPRVLVYDEVGALGRTFARYFGEAEFVEATDLAQLPVELESCPAQAVLLNTATPEATWPLVEAVRDRVGQTPIIGCAVPPQTRRAADAGAQGHLVKPVTRAALAHALQGVRRPIESVLVVDDDPDSLRLFRRMLRACDKTLEIVTAASGAEPLAAMRRQPFDLLLLDIVMPDMNGWQLLEIVKGDPTLANVAVFFVSAQDPADQTPTSPFVVAAIGGGLTLRKLLDCSLEVSTRLLQP